MKQLTISLLLSLLILGCAKNEQHEQTTEQTPTNKQPAAEETDQALNQTPHTGPQNGITISQKTTRIMEPLDDAGYVDYLQALNDRFAQGTTSQNNYEVVVRQVMTPEAIPEELRGKYFRLLGIPIPQKGTNFYRNFVDFTLKGNTNRQHRKNLLNVQDRIMTQPWRASQHPAASKWLAAQKQHLDQLAKGSRRDKFYTPYLTDDSEESEVLSGVIGMLMPSIQQQREIARGIIIRVMRRLGQGTEEGLDGAWSDLQAIHRIARHAGHGMTLIESLVAVAIDSIAFQGEIQVLKSPALTTDQCKRFFADLEALKPLPPLADRIDVGERYMGLDAVTVLARSMQGKDQRSVMNELFKALKLIGALSDVTPASDLVTRVAFQNDASKQKAKQVGNPIDWNTTLLVLNGWYDKLVAANRAADPRQRQAKLNKITQEIEQLKATLNNPTKQLTAMATNGSPKVLGEAIGNILAAILLPATSAVGQTQDEAAARIAVIRIGFAINLYAREKGTLPKSLADLSPRYLEAIPKDPHSGAALRYILLKKGFLLYSVGRNGVDDQGRSADDANGAAGKPPAGDDIVLRIGS